MPLATSVFFFISAFRCWYITKSELPRTDTEVKAAKIGFPLCLVVAIAFLLVAISG